jgi:hypothetical protein
LANQSAFPKELDPEHITFRMLVKDERPGFRNLSFDPVDASPSIAETQNSTIDRLSKWQLE